MLTFVKYLGDARYPNQTERHIDGMDTWNVGEEREFSDAFAEQFDRAPGSDFAEFFVHVQNANLKSPVFELTTRAKAKTDDSKASAKAGNSKTPKKTDDESETTDTSSASAPAQGA